MKRTQIMLACALVLALSGATTLRSAEEGVKEGKATIKAIHGTVEYLDNGAWVPARVNMKFGPGAAIRTAADGTADMSINGLSSAARITNNTVLRIPTMSYVGSEREGDRTTLLNLETGSIIGNVKKITANSRYEITTPHGVAGIRGTDYGASTFSNPDGTGTSTFSSFSGTVQAVGKVNGTMETFTLHSGESITFGGLGNPVVIPINPQTLQFFLNEIYDLLRIIFPPPPFEPGHPHPFPPPPFPGGPPRGPGGS